MDRDKMSRLYREPSIDASYQASVHLTKRFQSKRFFKITQSETRIACGGHEKNHTPPPPPPWKLNGLSLIEDLPRMLPTKFRLIWQSGFRGDLLEITQSETRIACGGHDC